jgi:endoglucanase Acf2
MEKRTQEGGDTVDIEVIAAEPRQKESALPKHKKFALGMEEAKILVALMCNYSTQRFHQQVEVLQNSRSASGDRTWML